MHLVNRVGVRRRCTPESSCQAIFQTLVLRWVLTSHKPKSCPKHGEASGESRILRNQRLNHPLKTSVANSAFSVDNETPDSMEQPKDFPSISKKKQPVTFLSRYAIWSRKNKWKRWRESIGNFAPNRKTTWKEEKTVFFLNCYSKFIQLFLLNSSSFEQKKFYRVNLTQCVL